jgi:hypothetical protein
LLIEFDKGVGIAKMLNPLFGTDSEMVLALGANMLIVSQIAGV